MPAAKSDPRMYDTGLLRDAEDRIAIPLSKAKLVLLTLGALAFVALGCILCVAPPRSGHDPAVVKVVGGAAIVFFGACLVYGVYKLFDRRPGLILDRLGLIDNSSAIAAGRITWQEIRDIKVSQIRTQRFLTLLIDDPDQFIARGNRFRRFLDAQNVGLTGSPVNISSGTLKIDFDELERLLRVYWVKYGRRDHAAVGSQ
jgi:hypothetical protein